VAGKSTRGSEKSRARGKSQGTARESVNKNHNRTVGSSSKKSDSEKPILGAHTKDSRKQLTSGALLVASRRTSQEKTQQQNKIARPNPGNIKSNTTDTQDAKPDFFIKINQYSYSFLHHFIIEMKISS
jgi:hypothetical protein